MKKITVYGLPLAPRTLLEQLAGPTASFCVSYGSRQRLGRQLDDAIGLVGQDGVLLVDNGAFSLYRKTAPHGFDEAYLADYEKWAADILARCPQAVAVVPDVIGGTEEQNAELCNLAYAFSPDRAMAIWHLNESFEFLTSLCESFGWVGFGSAGEYWQVGTPKWHARMKEAFAAIDKWEAESEGAYVRPRLHLMRAQSMLYLYDFDSADSTNLAMNHGRYRHQENHVAKIAARIDGKIQASAGPEVEHQLKRPLLAGHDYERWQENWMRALWMEREQMEANNQRKEAA